MENLLLLVEGRDDFYVVGELLKEHSLTQLRNPAEKPNPNRPLKLFFNNLQLDIDSVGSVDGVIEKFETTLKHGVRPKAVGLILDFDPPSETQAHNRDVALRNVIDRLQNKDCRWDLTEDFTVLSDAGFIAEPADANTPRVGIWFMPNNRDRGMLETFLQGLIPESQSGLLLTPGSRRTRQKRNIRLRSSLVIGTRQ